MTSLRMAAGVACMGPPSWLTAATNLECSSGDHRKRRGVFCALLWRWVSTSFACVLAKPSAGDAHAQGCEACESVMTGGNAASEDVRDVERAKPSLPLLPVGCRTSCGSAGTTASSAANSSSSSSSSNAASCAGHGPSVAGPLNIVISQHRAKAMRLPGQQGVSARGLAGPWPALPTR